MDGLVDKAARDAREDGIRVTRLQPMQGGGRGSWRGPRTRSSHDAEVS
jgi:hypothetical protein